MTDKRHSSAPVWEFPWPDPDAVGERLTYLGMSEAAAGQKVGLLFRALKGLMKLGETEGPQGRVGPEETRSTRPVVFFVPGRIEVLGKHTDYAGGRTVTMALERGFWFAATPPTDAPAPSSRLIRMFDALDGSRVEFPIDTDNTCRTECCAALDDWSNYPITVARRLSKNFPDRFVRGANISFASDLPPAAGMSSSSVLIVGTFLILARINNLEEDSNYRCNIDSKEALASYLAKIENGQTFGSLEGDQGVGTLGGSEDHTAMLCSQPGRLSQFVYSPIRLERRMDVPPGHIFVIGASGVVAQKTGGARERYNRTSRLVSHIVSLWQQATGENHPHLAAILASASDAADRLRQVLRQQAGGTVSVTDSFSSQDLLNRFEHFVEENERIIPAAGDALIEGNLDEFGRLIDQSQHLAERLLNNQVPQTIFLSRRARQLGAVAASSFGAGFGGSVWALVPARSAEEFIANWSRAYQQHFPDIAPSAVFFPSDAGPSAFEFQD